MTISLTLTVVKSFLNGMPTVSATASNASGIPGTPFVFASNTGAFDHPAQANDMRMYGPTTVPYYLTSVVTRSFDSINDANIFAKLLQDTANKLVADWSAQAGFEATVVQTYTG